MATCRHDGDEDLVIETVFDGSTTIRAPRCPQCGFRTFSITIAGQDVTDQFVVAEERSTWREWEESVSS